jgi:class 3 adenylate cyclase
MPTNSTQYASGRSREAAAEERTQRRLATILADDVVGYSRLIELDETGTLAVLKSRRKGHDTG